MRDRLPVIIDNLELPYEDKKEENYHHSYGYINILYILSIIITVGTIITVIIIKSR